MALLRSRSFRMMEEFAATGGLSAWNSACPNSWAKTEVMQLLTLEQLELITRLFRVIV